VLLVDQPRLEARSEEDFSVLEVHLLDSLADAPADALTPLEALSELGQRCENDPSLVISTVLHHREAQAKVLTLSGKVPGFGWSIWKAQQPQCAVHSPEPGCLSNGLVSVAFNPQDGTFSVNGQQGYGQIIDEVDLGDTYNWCPSDPQILVDRPVSTWAEVIESGPIRGRLVIYSEYQLPACAPTKETPHPITQIQAVTTTIELRAEEAFLRVSTELDNRIRDHRMRVHFPLQTRARTSSAECAFAVTHRPLFAEGGSNEWGVPTFPSRRFVQAGDLTLTHEGLCEYELVDLDGEPNDTGTTAGTLALTLLRSTGWLSRGPMASRPLPAGPENQLLGAQLQKSLKLNYAISVEPLNPYEFADLVWSPLLVTTSTGGGTLDNSGARLTVSGVEVDAVLTDSEGRLTLRCHEPFGQSGRLQISGRSGQVVDLLGAERGDFHEALELRPHEIVTVVLDHK
ncbi:MAG: glycoside hydrolase family 38 C-terminal domain-containing protein, partial [Microthrixaceae bacterium]